MKIIIPILAYLTKISISFRPWSCEKLDYVDISELRVGKELMVTESGINEAYCTKIEKIDGKNIVLENGARFKLDRKSKMGNNMQCDMQCSMNQMNNQMNQMMNQMQQSWSKSMSWSKTSSWSTGMSSNKMTKFNKMANSKKVSNPNVQNINADGSLPGSNDDCDLCDSGNSKSPTGMSHDSNLKVNLEIDINGDSKKLNFQESGNAPGMLNINTGGIALNPAL